MAASLPYHEPGIEDILILSSMLLAFNVINSVLDRTLYCGLVGQVLVGIAWGTPGGKWLSSSLEDAIVQLGYLGLIMIVFEGIFFVYFSSCNVSHTRPRMFRCNKLLTWYLPILEKVASQRPSQP